MALDMLVTESDLPNFLQQTATAQAAHIRSLTTTINYEHLVSLDQMERQGYRPAIHESLVAQALWTQLRNLARALPTMTALTTFALVVTRPRCAFWLPRDIITDLVKSLPRQCYNLEIDTGTVDRLREEEGPDEHLCKAINHAIPQLKHLRLRITAMCTALFSATSAPTLETVSINCFGGNAFSSGAQLCRPDVVSPRMHYHGNDAAPSVAQSLKTLAKRCPKLTLATVLDTTPAEYEDRSTHACYDIRDALTGKTYALPITDIWALEDGNVLLRTMNGKELVSSRATIALFAEGQPWKETAGGIRLPAAMFLAEDSAYTAKDLHSLTVAEWKEQNPRRSCSLWSNEKMAGRWLIDVTTFEGIAEHAPLKEDTPEGFMRDEDMMSDLCPLGPLGPELWRASYTVLPVKPSPSASLD